MADEKPESKAEASEEESEQSLLPKSFFNGKDLEIGTKCEVKIEGIYDDEVAVSYVPHKKDGDKDKPDRDTMDGAMNELESEATAAPNTGY
jgi:hypothetical protein